MIASKLEQPDRYRLSITEIRPELSNCELYVYLNRVVFVVVVPLPLLMLFVKSHSTWSIFLFSQKIITFRRLGICSDVLLLLNCDSIQPTQDLL